MNITLDKILISVVVCTFNRSHLLCKCLESLANQNIAGKLYEIIIVDNCSSDDTGAVVKRFTSQYEHFHYVFEEQAGLSHARNRGWREAHGQYVAYIDDDAIAYPNWISGIIDFAKRKPDVDLFGGPYDAYYLVSKPAWFPPEYGVFNLGEQERYIILGSEWISGSNMVIKKDLFYLYGGFDVRLGMIGSNVAYGEEVNFFISMHDKGIHIYYAPSIRVSHLVAEYKMSLSWLLLSGYSVGRRYELIFNKNESFLSHVTAFLSGLGSAICKMLRPVKIPFKRRLYYSLYYLYFEAGVVIEHVSSWIYEKKHVV